jgi:hypothetical protein
LVLIGLGLVLLVFQIVPGLRSIIVLTLTWPLIILGAGLFLLLLGIILGVPGMAIPACVVGGIGGLLYWQNLTGNWQSWVYTWSLIPGFVGAGMVLAGLMGSGRKLAVRGIRLVFISIIVFLIFASLLGGVNLFGPYWPVLLILAGILLLVRPLFRKKEQ